MLFFSMTIKFNYDFKSKDYHSASLTSQNSKHSLGNINVLSYNELQSIAHYR